MRLPILFLLTSSLFGQMAPLTVSSNTSVRVVHSRMATFTVSGNFPRDLLGPVDTRPYTWGHADSATLPIQFKPPAGYRVQILKLRGDLVSWPMVLEGGLPIPDNRYAGVLLGFSTTSSTGAAECDWCASGCFVYIQDAIHGGEARRAPFAYNLTKDNTYLDADNVLNLKIAAFLNTTNVPIHIEGTYTITGRFVPVSQPTRTK